MKRRSSLLALLGTLALALAACSPAQTESSKAGALADQASTELTFRLWDAVAAPAYERSFAAFTKKNPDISVKVEVVPWDNYWNQLPLDISADQMTDVYLVNSSNYALYADAGHLLDISEVVGAKHDAWQPAVVDLYTRNGSLWGIPQLWDSIALYYNKDLVSEAGVNPQNLRWSPNAGDGAGEDASGDAGNGDTLLAAAQALTRDAAGNTADSPSFDANKVVQYGFNAQADLQAIYLDFLAQNGAQFQNDDDSFAFASSAGKAAFQYLVDLINKYHVAPPAAETNVNGDVTREMFIRGELALFQSGPYNLKTIAEQTDVNWGIAPLVAGPQGRVSVVHGVAAVGNAQSKHRDATIKLLKWLGTAEGQLPLAEEGIAFPGATEAQEAFVNYWAKQGVDVSVFIDAGAGQTARAPFGAQVNAGSNALIPALLDVFLGTVSVSDGLDKAQEAGNLAMQASK